VALPEHIRVKLSSEAAESISITPVVVQDIPLRELIEQMLGITGKDEARIRELLSRGALVRGASRFRWSGWDADTEDLRQLLASFPDPDPGRAFAREQCVRAVLRGGRLPVEITRQAASRKPLLKRSSFWDVLMQAADVPTPRYCGYSYRERADYFALDLPVQTAERLRAAHGLLKYSVLREQVRTVAFDAAELYVIR